MINCIKGVSEAGSFLKQRGEAKKTSTEEPKKRVDDSGEHELKPKLNETKEIRTHHEVVKMDVEIVAILRRKPTVLPKEAPNDVSKMKLKRIQKDNWSVAFQQSARDGTNVHKFLFSLSEKHLYSSSYLNYIVGITDQYKVNDVADKK
ncbi:unnamed protein product [Lactuca saligna]|uniref:Uncharacterized protein n=1 Tax=Lactuca saligna TaxID=75948 RepID=A0AA35ZCK3_LACSI|nr:unnamed protein product [Lactuca saligna]